MTDMAILKIARMGHPVLVQSAQAIDDPSEPALRRLVADMAETMLDAEGIGLAAPQVHQSLRLILFVDVADRAEASWRQALALDATDLQSLAGMAAQQFARGRYLEARAFAERWLALAPQDADGLRLASQIEQKLGDNAAAQRYLARLQANSPGTPTAPRAQ